MSLIMEGIRRKDEWGRIRQVIVSSRAVPEKTETRLKTDALKSTSLILRTYEAVDGLRTVEEIALHLHASEFEVTLTLFRLHEKGIVTILAEKPEPEVASFLILTEKLFNEAELALAEGRFGGGPQPLPVRRQGEARGPPAPAEVLAGRGWLA